VSCFAAHAKDIQVTPFKELHLFGKYTRKTSANQLFEHSNL